MSIYLISSSLFKLYTRGSFGFCFNLYWNTRLYKKGSTFLLWTVYLVHIICEQCEISLYSKSVSNMQLSIIIYTEYYIIIKDEGNALNLVKKRRRNALSFVLFFFSSFLSISTVILTFCNWNEFMTYCCVSFHFHGFYFFFFLLR